MKIYIHGTVHLNNFLFNNQPDALIIQIYSVIKLYTFRAFLVYCFNLHTSISQNFITHFNNTVHMYIFVIFTHL